MILLSTVIIHRLCCAESIEVEKQGPVNMKSVYVIPNPFEPFPTLIP
jgi:hypothetical protein